MLNGPLDKSVCAVIEHLAPAMAPAATLHHFVLLFILVHFWSDTCEPTCVSGNASRICLFVPLNPFPPRLVLLQFSRRASRSEGLVPTTSHLAGRYSGHVLSVFVPLQKAR